MSAVGRTLALPLAEVSSRRKRFYMKTLTHLASKQDYGELNACLENFAAVLLVCV